MRIGIVGLGKMGGNMVRRWIEGGHEVVAFDREPARVAEIVKAGGGRAIGAASLPDLVAKLGAVPRVAWVMIPPGAPTSETIAELSNLLAKDDVVIDGGNSRYKDSVTHAAELAAKGIRFLDVGTSGGIWGLQVGYCLMVGGDESAYEHVLPLLETLAPKDGLGYFGRAGAGHYAKMVHNGIEYAMMQAYGEGFELLKDCPYTFDVAKVAKVWNHGSVVRSWLLELAERAFDADPQLAHIEGYVQDTGEGRWTVEECVENGVSAPTIALSLFTRFASRKENAFGLRVVAALRKEFGGHAIKQV